MNLKSIGWSDPWESLYPEITSSQLARVTVVHKNQCRAWSESGELTLYLRGNAVVPATGDWVEISPPFEDQSGGQAAVIIRCLERLSAIKRRAAGSQVAEQVIAANVNWGLVVTSCNHEFNLNRLERYVQVIQSGGVRPAVVLSKTDLDPRYSERVLQINARFPDVPVLTCSVTNHDGVESIAQLLEVGQTGVLLGSSGVGKSTLLNALLGRSAQETQDVREGDSKGRHTTTSREIFLLPRGGMIIDSAGMREIGLVGPGAPASGPLEQIEILANACRFSNCRHEGEPGCEVEMAIAREEVKNTDLARWRKLQREIEHLQFQAEQSNGSQQVHLRNKNRKAKWKTITKSMRAKRRFEGRD